MNKNELIESLKAKGFSEQIVAAFSEVDRMKFVPEEFIPYAYEDTALPIGEGCTISQPSTIAFMLELLEPQKGQKILEVGAGTGYALALLNSMVKEGEIYGVEIKENAIAEAKRRLADKMNIKIFHRNGAHGLPENAPFDRILISAYCPDIETIKNVLDQLKDNGILVVPIKDSLTQIKKVNNNLEKHEFPGFSFVPLVSEGL
ncbi:MAG: methyltransferase domain-containing protein [Nanoarchaeota archaeon]